MQVFFSSRDKARAAGFGVMCDNGKQADKGKRFARSIEAKPGNKATMVVTSPTFGRVVPVFVRGRNKL